MPKSKRKSIYFFPEYEIRRREYGFKQEIGWESSFKYSLYSTLSPTNFHKTDRSSNENPDHGGIFNFAFSKDGRQLAAACENKCILFYDPITQKQIHSINKAHTGCVNCVRFLDSRLFATCSDDNTVALWDVRKLNRRIRVLGGHGNWVKNIEYSSRDSLLVASGFDGGILGWDLNSFHDDGMNFSELFHMKGLMRVRLTPDENKLVICTTSGYMVLIHNLDLLNLPKDWKEFQNKVYGIDPEKRHKINLPNSARNRFEFISDFPAGNTAEVIHSLQVHPQGWCVLSRNTSTENSSEWTCVHDIQDIEKEKEDSDDEIFEPQKCNKSCDDNPEAAEPPSDDDDDEPSIPIREMRRRSGLSFSRIEGPRIEFLLRHMRENRHPPSDTSDDSDDASDHPDPRQYPREGLLEASRRDFEGFEGTDGSIQLRLTSLGILEALEGMGVLQQDQWRLWRTTPPSGSSEQATSNSSPPSSNLDFTVRCRRRESSQSQPRSSPNYRSAFFAQERPIRSSPVRPVVFITRPHSDDKVFTLLKRTPRLTNYAEELNKGRGFIKELCFSSDGRIICSPYGRGVRLLMFDNKCSELSHCVQVKPQPLHPVSKTICHSKCVVSTQFSPTDCLLVSGCLSGEIVWHQPGL